MSQPSSGLVSKGDIVEGTPQRAATVGVALVFTPFLRQIQAAIQQGVACEPA